MTVEAGRVIGVPEAKERLRREIRRRMEERDDRVAPHRQSERAQKKVIGLPEFQAARTVGCYVAMPGEMRTERIMKEAWKAGKKVAVPALRPEP